MAKKQETEFLVEVTAYRMVKATLHIKASSKKEAAELAEEDAHEYDDDIKWEDFGIVETEVTKVTQSK